MRTGPVRLLAAVAVALVRPPGSGCSIVLRAVAGLDGHTAGSFCSTGRCGTAPAGRHPDGFGARQRVQITGRLPIVAEVTHGRRGSWAWAWVGASGGR